MTNTVGLYCLAAALVIMSALHMANAPAYLTIVPGILLGIAVVLVAAGLVRRRGDPAGEARAEGLGSVVADA